MILSPATPIRLREPHWFPDLRDVTGRVHYADAASVHVEWPGGRWSWVPVRMVIVEGENN